MVPEIRPATVADIEVIAPRVRAADRRELWDAYGQLPVQVIDASFQASSSCWTGTVDGQPIVMFGVVPVTAGIGRPWMIGTDLVEVYQKIFLKRCRGVVAEFHREYELLVNWVAADNKQALQWLAWLGFTILPAEIMGHNLKPFHKFERWRDD